MLKKVLYLGAICLISITTASSQEEWSLKRCLEYAVENSFDIYQSDLDIQRSQINTSAANQQRYPGVNGSTNAFWNFGRSIDPTTNEFITQTFFSNGYGVNANMTLFDGGRIKNDIAQNKIFEKISQANKNSAINTLMINIVGSFFEVLFAQDNQKNIELQLKTINDQIDQMKKLVDAGSRAQFEIYDLEAQKASSEQSVTIAENRVTLAYLSLKALLNLPSDYDMTVSVPDLEQGIYTNLESVTLDEAFEKALAFQPAANRLDYQIESAMIGIDLAKSQFYPSLGVGASLNTNFSNQGREISGFTTDQISANVLIDNQPATITTEQVNPTFAKSPYFSQIDNNFGYGFGFSLNVPIYNRGATKASVSRAEIDLENAQVEKSKYQVSLKNDMMQLITDAKAAQRSLQAAEKTMNAREIAYDNAEKRYELGAINSYDYVNIQDQLNTAKTDYLLAKYDYIMKVKLLDYYQGYPVGLE